MPQKVEEFLISDIGISDIAIRGEDTKNEEYIRLKANIEQRVEDNLPALLQPIILREQKNEETGKKELILVDGLQRLTAHKELGLEKITGINRGVMDIEQAMLEQYASNHHRVREKPAQEGRQFLRLCAERDMDVVRLARITGNPIEYVATRIGIANKLAPEIQALVDDKSISVLKAKALCGLDPEEQKGLISEAMQMDREKFIQLVAQRKKEIRAAIVDGKKPKKIEWEPIVRLRKKQELEREVSHQNVANTLFKKPEEQKAFIEGVKYALSLDEATLQKDREKFEREQAEKEREKKAREIERQRKKSAEAAAKASEIEKEFD